MAWNRLALYVGTAKSPYVIAEQSTDGTLACSCWPWRKTRRACKHIKATATAVLEGVPDRKLTVLQPVLLRECLQREVVEADSDEADYAAMKEELAALPQ